MMSMAPSFKCWRCDQNDARWMVPGQKKLRNFFMKYEQEFDLTFYLNCGRHEDQRRRMQNLFLDHGLSKVKRLPAVDVRRVKRLCP